MLKIRVMNISKKDLAQDAQEATRARPGTRARSSRRSTRRSTASSAASRSAAWSATTTSTTARPTSSCSARWRRSRPPRTRRSSPAPSPSLMQMDSWQELANPRDLTKIFQTPEYARWRSLREVRGRALHRPRDAALPGAAALRRQDQPGRGVRLRGGHRGRRHDKYTWANAAYAMAVNINRSFKLYGWCSRIRGVESGGAVEGLPRTPSRPTTAAST